VYRLLRTGDGEPRRIPVDEPTVAQGASHTLFNTYLVSGMPPSALSSHAILAELQPEETDEHVRSDGTPFAKLGVLRSVALKVKKSAAISRPARDAREALKEMAVDGEERLVGIFSADLVVCRQTLSMSNGDAGTFCGACDWEGHLVRKYVDVGVRRITCCTFPTTIASLSVVGPNVIAYLAACKSWGQYRGKVPNN
jgi:hypothetical protein